MLHKPIGQTSVHMSDYTTYLKNATQKFIQIAPAPDRKILLSPEEPRKYNYKSNPQSTSIARRNARERNRVKQVNDSFTALRKKLPAAVIAALAGGSRRGSGKKLSKVDTLRMVVEYIRYLENIIEDSDITLGTQRKTGYNDASNEHDGKFDDRTSPFSYCAASPLGSECSSGVSSNLSSEHQYLFNNYQIEGHHSPLEQEDLFNSMSWWDEK